MFDFESVRPFDTIVITGPQRSGTTICAKIIAEELHRHYVDEQEYEVHFFGRFWSLLQPGNVIHAPAMSATCHLLPPSIAVVFVRREIAEIIESQQDVPSEGGKMWTAVEEPVELQKYFRPPDAGPIAKVKYDVWDSHQKPMMEKHGKRYFELNFPQDIEGHRLYLAPDKRQGWAPRQTAPQSSPVA